eukprot:96527_1
MNMIQLLKIVIGKKITINKQSILLDMLDTAGQEEFCCMQDGWIRVSSLFIICFAINDKDSWNEIPNIRNRIMRCKNSTDTRGMILVATKCDLKYMNVGIENDDVFIDENIIMQMANDWDVPYIETSAKLDKNVDFVFEMIAYEHIRQTCQ